MTDHEIKPQEPLQPETLPAEKPQQKNLIRSAKDFWENTFGKSTDLGGAVEQFTSEMTLVVEGLSEDQTRISSRLDRVQADLTQTEEALRAETDALRQELKVNGKALHQLEEKLGQLEKQTLRLQENEQKNSKEKKEKKDGLLAVLKQSTILVGILAGAWIIVTILNFFK